jgi:hypothetical protein
VQGLIDARLVRAERAAALEDKDDLALLLRRLFSRSTRSPPHSLCRGREISSIFSS